MGIMAAYCELRTKPIVIMNAFIIAIGLLGGITSSYAEVRPVVLTVNYDDVSLNKLISTYKQAYEQAGFKLKEKRKPKALVPGGRIVTHLVFEFAIPEYHHKHKGVASFVIASSSSQKGNCEPCSVHREFFGVHYDDYDASETMRAQSRMNSADAKTNAQIRAILGKSLPDRE